MSGFRVSQKVWIEEGRWKGDNRIVDKDDGKREQVDNGKDRWDGKENEGGMDKL